MVTGIPEEVSVYFLLYRLLETQQQWSVIERHMLPCTQCRSYYLSGAVITIKTNHKACQYLLEKYDPAVDVKIEQIPLQNRISVQQRQHL